MRKFTNIFLGLFFISLLSSCSKTIYFTQEMRLNLYKNHLQITKVQFYNSKKIALKRNLSYKATKLARGTIKLENGQYMKEIIIPKNTPGVIETEGKNMLNVSFEHGKNRALRFVLNDDNRYQLSALIWSGDYGRVVYDTLVYYIEPSSAKALLKIKKDNSFTFKKNIRKVKGRLLSLGQ